MANCGETAEESSLPAAAATPVYVRRSPSPRPTPHSPVVKRFIETQASRTQTDGLHPLVLRATLRTDYDDDPDGAKG